MKALAPILDEPQKPQNSQPAIFAKNSFVNSTQIQPQSQSQDINHVGYRSPKAHYFKKEKGIYVWDAMVRPWHEFLVPGNTVGETIPQWLLSKTKKEASSTQVMKDPITHQRFYKLTLENFAGVQGTKVEIYNENQHRYGWTLTHENSTMAKFIDPYEVVYSLQKFGESTYQEKLEFPGRTVIRTKQENSPEVVQCIENPRVATFDPNGLTSVQTEVVQTTKGVGKSRTRGAHYFEPAGRDNKGIRWKRSTSVIAWHQTLKPIPTTTIPPKVLERQVSDRSTFWTKWKITTLIDPISRVHFYKVHGPAGGDSNWDTVEEIVNKDGCVYGNFTTSFQNTTGSLIDIYGGKYTLETDWRGRQTEHLILPGFTIRRIPDKWGDIKVDIVDNNVPSKYNINQLD